MELHTAAPTPLPSPASPHDRGACTGTPQANAPLPHSPTETEARPWTGPLLRQVEETVPLLILQALCGITTLRSLLHLLLHGWCPLFPLISLFTVISTSDHLAVLQICILFTSSFPSLLP